MGLLQQIKENLKTAMKGKREIELSVLRLVSAAIKNEAINSKKSEQDLSEEEVIKVLKKEAKKRKDAIDSYSKGGRNDLAQGEEKELEIINKYLPAEMGEVEIGQIVDEVLSTLTDINFGVVMKEVVSRLAGRADGKLVSRVVKDKLSGK